ncbi:hypothetical protein X975_16017, partial [Stegodyphus mimosarum]
MFVAVAFFEISPSIIFTKWQSKKIIIFIIFLFSKHISLSNSSSSSSNIEATELTTFSET